MKLEVGGIYRHTGTGLIAMCVSTLVKGDTNLGVLQRYGMTPLRIAEDDLQWEHWELVSLPSQSAKKAAKPAAPPKASAPPPKKVLPPKLEPKSSSPPKSVKKTKRSKRTTASS